MLFLLRKTLPDAQRFLSIEPETVQWRPESPFTLDLAEFENAQAQPAGDANSADALREMLERAVAFLPSLAELCLPFVRIGGTFAAEKGSQVEEEMKAARRAIQLLGGQHLRVEETPLPGVEEPRHVVLVAKKRPTPPEYPRRAGVPGSKPL